MRLLLDTHAVIWWLVYPERLSLAARDAIGDQDNEILVSAVTGYEIELKRSRDPSLSAVPWQLEESVLAQRFSWLPILPAHSIQAGRLPLNHRDPWDRVLVAQAQVEDAILVTADGWMASYGVRTLW